MRLAQLICLMMLATWAGRIRMLVLEVRTADGWDIHGQELHLVGQYSDGVLEIADQRLKLKFSNDSSNENMIPDLLSSQSLILPCYRFFLNLENLAAKFVEHLLVHCRGLLRVCRHEIFRYRVLDKSLDERIQI